MSKNKIMVKLLLLLVLTISITPLVEATTITNSNITPFQLIHYGIYLGAKISYSLFNFMSMRSIEKNPDECKSIGMYGQNSEGITMTNTTFEGFDCAIVLSNVSKSKFKGTKIK